MAKPMSARASAGASFTPSPTMAIAPCLALSSTMAVSGNATLWMAVFADMGASLLVVFNGLRLLRK